MLSFWGAGAALAEGFWLWRGPLDEVTPLVLPSTAISHLFPAPSSPASPLTGAVGTMLLGRVVAVLFVTLKLLLDKNQTMKLLDMRGSLTCQFLLLASDNPPVPEGGVGVFCCKLNNKILFASAGSGWGFGDCRKIALL